MTTTRFSYLCLGAASLAVSMAPAMNADIVNAAGQPAAITKAQAITHFESINQQSSLGLRDDGSIARVYGRAFSTGPTTAISAQRFLDQNIGMWGVSMDELVAKGPFADGNHTQPIGYLQDTDTYKFTGHYYMQEKQGVPVFRSKLVLLVRNDAGKQLVLASSQLHDLRDFQMAALAISAPVNQAQITEIATKAFDNAVVDIESTERVVFAGVDSSPVPPRLADATTVFINGFEQHLIVTDANTGEILFQENLIHTVDVTGNASGLATQGVGSDNCEAEAATPLPYLSVGVQGGNSVFTDVNGDFTIPHGGSSAVTVNGGVSGQWFDVTNFLGSETSESTGATPPGPANLLYNSANNNEQIRSQINAYIEANRVRDFVIAANPAYPGMQFQMDIFVNRNDGYCPGNAWYSPSEQTINFCLSGSSNPNTAWSSVVHHEYGHHMVNVGGSGQGMYGEGMGDVMSTIILDDNRLGLGFFGSCNSSLRNADNNHQYPCIGGGHDCGQLISGCVWDTRNALVFTEPDNYTDILNFLAVNAILVHSGSEITPQITIDWLTLDDDDGDIGNGTPHYAEIAEGFGNHNMDAPALNLLSISYPAGRPEFVSPNGGTTMVVDFQPLAGAVDTSTPTLMVNTGSGYNAYPMVQLSGTQFEASFPSNDCGSGISYYITAETTGGSPQSSPTDAPAAGSFSALSAFGAPSVVFEDNFQTDTGWTVSGGITSLLAGKWERDVPTGAGQRGDPANDADSSGSCFLTGNGNPGANNDVDDGSTILTSPVMDASGSTVIGYSRWYDNTFGGSPEADIFVVEVSDDAGASWTNLETVGPAGSEVAGGWISKEFSLGDVAGFTTNDQFQIRFTASDLGTGSVVEAGVDAVALSSFDCSPCPADINGDGALNFFDISEFLALFSGGDSSADFNDDGAFNFFDISAFLSAFSAGCP